MLFCVCFSASRCISSHHIVVLIFLADGVQRASEERLVLRRTFIVVEEPQMLIGERQQARHRWNGSGVGAVAVDDVVPADRLAAAVTGRINVEPIATCASVFRRRRTWPLGLGVPDLHISTVVVVVARCRHKLIDIHVCLQSGINDLLTSVTNALLTVCSILTSHTHTRTHTCNV